MRKILMVLGVLWLGAASAVAAKPNFVVVVVDDLGWRDLACYGSPLYETPNLDALAKRGVLFTDGYASHPVCSPTRAALVTGKNPARKEINITDWIPGQQRQSEKLLPPKLANDLALGETTIAERLKLAGYSTWFLGKWHLGHDAAHWPEAHGFDVNIGGWSVGGPRGGYYSPYNNPRLKSGPEGEYLPDRLTNEAIALVKQRDKTKPFLLYLAFYTVHTPIQASKRHVAHYQAKVGKLPAAKASVRPEGRGGTRLRQDNAAYGSMVHAMDENVGRLLDALKAEGVDDNTVVFFTSDNGGLSTLDRGRPGPTSELPLRAGKGWCYEGGIRVPWIVYDPAQPGKDRKCATPIYSADLYPTILDRAGIQAMPSQHKDGVSFRSLLADPAASLDRTEPMVWHYPHYHGSGWLPGSAIREGDWKLVEHYHDNKIELFNLAADLSESKDLSASEPERAKALHAKLKAYLEKVGAANVTPNPDPKPRKKPRTPKKKAA